MIEIERKFLVKSDAFKAVATASYEIAQGYLNSNPERTVRIRIKGEKGFITIKGLGNASGMSRFEWEKEIPIDEAKQLLSLCEQGIIEKTRFEVNIGNHLYEIDEFYGANKGLLLAEVELTFETEKIEMPNWLGVEVTKDSRYYNAYLSQHPFCNW